VKNKSKGDLDGPEDDGFDPQAADSVSEEPVPEWGFLGHEMVEQPFDEDEAINDINDQIAALDEVDGDTDQFDVDNMDVGEDYPEIQDGGCTCQFQRRITDIPFLILSLFLIYFP
jgi:hypothetical protein